MVQSHLFGAVFTPDLHNLINSLLKFFYFAFAVDVLFVSGRITTLYTASRMCHALGQLSLKVELIAVLQT